MTTLRTADDSFLGEVDTIDFSPIRGKQFLIAINSGDRQQAGLIPESIKGPLSFCEMVEEAGRMWQDDSHHAKVLILNGKDFADWLDEPTIDAIEARHVDILFQEAFHEACGVEADEGAEYACAIVKNQGPTFEEEESK